MDQAVTLRIRCLIRRMSRAAIIAAITASVLIIVSASPREAGAHRAGCRVSKQATADGRRVYPFGAHGCIWLKFNRDTTTLTVVTRVHGRTRSFKLPRSALDASAVGVCFGAMVWNYANSWGTVVAQQLFPDPNGGCDSGRDHSAIWVFHGNPKTGLIGQIWTNRGSGTVGPPSELP